MGCTGVLLTFGTGQIPGYSPRRSLAHRCNLYLVPPFTTVIDIAADRQPLHLRDLERQLSRSRLCACVRVEGDVECAAARGNVAEQEHLRGGRGVVGRAPARQMFRAPIAAEAAAPENVAVPAVQPKCLACS